PRLRFGETSRFWNISPDVKRITHYSIVFHSKISWLLPSTVLSTLSALPPGYTLLGAMKPNRGRGVSRRRFLGAAATARILRGLDHLAAAERKRVRIRDVQTMTMQGASRTYVLVRIVSDDGLHGIGEAYGTPGVGVSEQILSIKPWLIGKDPLEIDTLYTELGVRTKDLSGTRTDGSAHNLIRAASGIEMALWDLAGKVLSVPSSTLLGGKFRNRVRVYDHETPRDMLDKASCREWTQKIHADPSGFTAHKFGFPHTNSQADHGRDLSNKQLSTKELMQVRQGFENCREAIGWNHDIMVHCHGEYDLRTSIQLAQAV